MANSINCFGLNTCKSGASVAAMLAYRPSMIRPTDTLNPPDLPDADMNNTGRLPGVNQYGGYAGLASGIPGSRPDGDPDITDSDTNEQANVSDLANDTDTDMRSISDHEEENSTESDIDSLIDENRQSIRTGS